MSEKTLNTVEETNINVDEVIKKYDKEVMHHERNKSN